MDGPHDLGGRQGFGPVAVNEREESFHSEWEGRMWGIARALKWPAAWNIDWWRHGRELIDPIDYLSRPYFDQWMQNYAALLVDSGVITVAELAAPPTAVASSGAKPIDRETLNLGDRFDREVENGPRFVPGDAVVANQLGEPGHTRLPGYMRGRSGVVDHYYGAHILPDANAQGEARVEPLYSVKFAAKDLWPEAAQRREWIYADLWESYLGPA